MPSKAALAQALDMGTPTTAGISGDHEAVVGILFWNFTGLCREPTRTCGWKVRGLRGLPLLKLEPAHGHFPPTSSVATGLAWEPRPWAGKMSMFVVALENLLIHIRQSNRCWCRFVPSYTRKLFRRAGWAAEN